MVQFNLLPDVKIKYITARRKKRLTILWAGVISAVSLAVFAIMLGYVYVLQGSQIRSVNTNIANSLKSIQNKQAQVDDINKVLTIQNQLNSLDALHDSKPRTSRIFDYLTKLTPSQVTISNINISIVEGSETISIQGSTDTLETVNRFVDTLKFTRYIVENEDPEGKTIFSEVVLNSFSRDGSGASYSIAMKFDPVIFDSNSSADKLRVPKDFITTRSELGRPVLQTETERSNNAPAPINEGSR